jgi:hypothetical protein
VRHERSLELAERPLREMSHERREQQRRDRHDPDPGEPVEQIVGMLAERERRPHDEPPRDQGAAQHQETDHRLMAEPGQEEERLDRLRLRAGHIRVVVANRVQAQMEEQDQESREPADLVEERAQLRAEPRSIAWARTPRCRSRS